VAAGTTNAEPAPSSGPLGPCPTPGCGGEIVERSRSYGCTSWRSRSRPGCGFVVWKRERGHDVSREEALERMEQARAAADGAPERERARAR